MTENEIIYRLGVFPVLAFLVGRVIGVFLSNREWKRK